MIRKVKKEKEKREKLSEGCIRMSRESYPIRQLSRLKRKLAAKTVNKQAIKEVCRLGAELT